MSIQKILVAIIITIFAVTTNPLFAQSEWKGRCISVWNGNELDVLNHKGVAVRIVIDGLVNKDSDILSEICFTKTVTIKPKSKQGKKIVADVFIGEENVKPIIEKMIQNNIPAAEVKTAIIVEKATKKRDLEMENESPLARFMGAAWGCTVNEFLLTVKHRKHIQKRGGFFSSYAPGFYMDNFKLTDSVTLSTVKFHFKPKNKNVEKMKLSKKNYDKMVLDSVYIWYNPDQFQELYNIFLQVYGKPWKKDESTLQNRMGATFKQYEVYWKDEKIKRIICLSRYGNRFDEGFITFHETNPEEFIKKHKKKIKSAASKL